MRVSQEIAAPQKNIFKRRGQFGLQQCG